MSVGEIVPMETGTDIMDYREAPGALESITRAEVDIQIATAKRYPRSIDRFLKEACSMVGYSAQIAEACQYSLPARRGSTERIEGPSVRLAECVAACYGNMRVMGRIVDDNGKMITAQGLAIDLERNLAYSVEVQRGVTTRDGRRYGDDMIRVTCAAAIAIATRNATLKVIPKALVQVVADHAAAVARGDERTLPERLSRALGWFKGKGVREEEVWAALGIRGAADATLDHLMTLNGYRTAIQEGTATADEIFRAPTVAGVVQQPGESRADALARGLAERQAKVESMATPVNAAPEGTEKAPEPPPVAVEVAPAEKPKANGKSKQQPLLSDAEARAEFGPGADG